MRALNGSQDGRRYSAANNFGMHRSVPRRLGQY